MSLTGDRTIRHVGYADIHHIAPRRVSHVIEVVGLLAVFLGDLVAFYLLAAEAIGAESAIIWTLVVALSAAAALTMHLAGTIARARQTDEAHPGLLWSVVLVVAWLALGAGSLWFRLAGEAGNVAASVEGGLGAPVDTGAGTHTALAALLLMLYLVGGLTAYGIGYRMHNPARSAFLRARSGHRRALRSYRRALRLNDRAQRTPWRWWPLLRGPLPREVARRPVLAAVPSTEESFADALEGAQTPREPIDELAARREPLREQSHAQAEQLKQVARHRIAVAFEEPARTSGVFATARTTPTLHTAPGNDG